MSSTSEPPRRSVTVSLPSGRGLVRAVGALIVVVLIATMVVEAVRLHDLSNDKSHLAAQLNAAHGQAPDGTGSGAGLSDVERSALAAAKTYATEFATYNYRDFDSQLALTESHSIDPFLSQYRSEAAPLRSSIIKVKSVSTAKVISAGIASISSTNAVADLFLDQTISNSSRTTPQVEPQRIEMTLTRRGGRWLISKVLLP
jgi:hypothetical protein